ncbi:MAG: hypothetical protein C0485_16075 [Pirellula sp.]|nr:hypothetical protein [Pirellula sp.]
MGKAVAADEDDPWNKRNAVFAANDRLPGRPRAARVDYCLGWLQCSWSRLSEKCAVAQKIMRLTQFGESLTRREYLFAAGDGGLGERREIGGGVARLHMKSPPNEVNQMPDSTLQPLAPPGGRLPSW